MTERGSDTFNFVHILTEHMSSVRAGGVAKH